MKSLICSVSRVLEFLVVLILSAMSLLVFVNVLLRYGFNSSINITEEVSRYLFVWLAFLGAVLAFNENLHVNVTLLTSKLSAVKQKLLRLITDGAMLFCCYLILVGSWVQFQLNLTNIAPISGLPQGITFLASVIASSLIGILLAVRLVSNFTVLIKGESL